MNIKYCRGRSGLGILSRNTGQAESLFSLIPPKQFMLKLNFNVEPQVLMGKNLYKYCVATNYTCMCSISADLMWGLFRVAIHSKIFEKTPTHSSCSPCFIITLHRTLYPVMSPLLHEHHSWGSNPQSLNPFLLHCCPL